MARISEAGKEKGRVTAPAKLNTNSFVESRSICKASENNDKDDSEEMMIVEI